MRVALKSKGRMSRNQVADVVTVAAPIGGWNARDALADMPPTDAVRLENFFPGTSSVDLRLGSGLPRTAFVNGTTLHVFSGLTGANRLFNVGSSIVDNSLYTGVGTSTEIVRDPAGNPILSSFNALGWTSTMFGDGTNNYLILANGSNYPLYFDNTSLYGGATYFQQIDSTTSPALSGVDSRTLHHPTVYQGRLFFLQFNTLTFWYLAAGSAGGSLTSFDLSAECKRGGYLVAMSNWTRDAGDGQDDIAVFLTSEGELVMYQGNNPSSASAWAKVGTFYVGRPLGGKCMTQFGGDLLILTENGIFPISMASHFVEGDRRFALSYKIDRAFVEAAQLYRQNPGWCLVYSPRHNALIVNVPKTNDPEQFVMNTITKAWGKFTNWPATDFTVFNGELFFSMPFSVITYTLQAFYGPTDVATWEYYSATGSTTRARVGSAKQAFQYIGKSAAQKQVKQMRPILSVDGSLTYTADVDIDFQDSATGGNVTYTSTAALWDTAIWDTAVWSDTEDIAQSWILPSASPGFAHAPKLDVTTDDVGVRWIATDLLVESGGVL